MKMPPQLSVLALVLLLYFWPWQLFSGDEPVYWLASVLVMQLIFVMACNMLSSESWCVFVILIEAVCMIFNSLSALIPATLFSVHADIITAAFIIELLVITMSLQGAAVGRSNCSRAPLGRYNMGHLRRNSLGGMGNNEAHPC